MGFIYHGKGPKWANSETIRAFFPGQELKSEAAAQTKKKPLPKLNDLVDATHVKITRKLNKRNY